MLTTELARLKIELANQKAGLKTKLLALLRQSLDTDTPLYLWFWCKKDIDLLLEHGSQEVKVHFDANGMSLSDHPLRVSGWWSHRDHAVNEFESLGKIWGDVVTLSEIELGGNDTTLHMKVQLSLE